MGGPSLPKSFIPNGSMNSKLRFWSLTVKSSRSEQLRQKPRSSIVFRPFCKTQIIRRNARPSKMRWQTGAL